MNVDDNNIEPVTNLSLALGYSNQCIQRILNNDDPGAGANAASRLDMTFVATDPLSELVWSPQKGLSFKCADGSLFNKKPSLLWGVGHTDMASGSSSDKPIRSIDKPINEKKFMASLAACNPGSEVAGGDDSTRFPTSETGIMPFSGSSNELKTGEPEVDVAQNDQTWEEHTVRATNVSDENQASGMEIFLASGIHTVKECEPYDTKMKNATSLGKGHEELPSIIEKDRKNKIVMSPAGLFPLEKLESTAENDLETPLDENACGLKRKIAALESANRGETNSQQGDELLPTDKTLAIKQSFTTSKIQRDKKGKSKALSDLDASDRMLNEEEGSHESVESCNSTRLFSTGKRRWNSDQQLIVGSKRVKGQIQESPSSLSLFKQDSSFMNWISNMMKGFSKSSGGKAPSLSPALANSDHEHENPDQDFSTFKRNEDPGCRTVGFQSIFQSLYSQKTKGQESITLNADHRTEGSEELKVDNKVCDLNATPIACRMVTGNVYKRFLPSNERFNETASGNKLSPVVHSKDVYMNFAAIQENNSSNATENKNSCNLATDKERDGTRFNSSQGKQMINSIEKIDSEQPSEGKTACNFGSKGELLESLWITRFTPKVSGPLSNRDISSKSTSDALDCSADGLRQKTQLENPLDSSSEHENVKVREQSIEEPQRVQNYGTAAEASFGFYKIKTQCHDKSISKLNPILLSPRLKNSDAMASVFARRLDALKHITDSDEQDNAAHATMTCFFCGIKGHHLQECSEIPESELEDLLRNTNLYNGVKELHRLCIKCFQPNHWAVACPNACSRTRNQAECDDSLVNQSGPSKMQLDVRNEDNIKLKDAAGGALTVCDRNYSGVEKNPNLTWKSNEAVNSGYMKLNVNFFEKDIASSSVEKKLKEKLMAPSYELNYGQISDAPKGTFDTIRRLRLSRTDILKWTNSHMPFSHLAGFFLRLRLGKWEEVLGGTGYYVACITESTGAQMESSPRKSKKSIAVNVGGIKCLVESQYVSNHDFLEDELMAWWSATSRSGGKLPSEEELRLKFEEKKMLGF